MTPTTKLATVAAAVTLAVLGAPLAHAGTDTSCDDWGSYTHCRTTSYDISTDSGFTVDCYYYQDGSSQCD